MAVQVLVLVLVGAFFVARLARMLAKRAR